MVDPRVRDATRLTDEELRSQVREIGTAVIRLIVEEHSALGGLRQAAPYRRLRDEVRRKMGQLHVLLGLTPLGETICVTDEARFTRLMAQMDALEREVDLLLAHMDAHRRQTSQAPGLESLHGRLDCLISDTIACRRLD